MKLITSEMDAETDRWTEAQNAAQQQAASMRGTGSEAVGGGMAGGVPAGAASVGGGPMSPTGGGMDENNDIVKRARNMSSMAFSMYQFTRGEGTLKTTQDLFTQAEYFAEEANRLYKVVRQFCYQVRLSYFALSSNCRINEWIFLCPKGTCWNVEERAAGLRWPNSDVRPAVAVYR